MGRVTAAGRSLTMGELQEMINGLHDSTPVLAHGMPVMAADTCPTEVHLDEELDFQELLDLVYDVAHRVESPGELRKRALEIVGKWAWE